LTESQASVPTEYFDHYSMVFARIRGSVLHAAGRVDEAAAALEAGVALATESDEASYEWALIVVSLERIDPTRVDATTIASARETLRTLGVRRVPGVDL